MNLLSQLSWDFAVTSHVSDEIADHYLDQRQRFNSALSNGILTELLVDEPLELSIFAFLTNSGRLGVGECSAIAVAINRGFELALDDRRARHDALTYDETLKIVGTHDLIVRAITEQLIDVSESDHIKDLWENEHRFKLKFNSFADLL